FFLDDRYRRYFTGLLGLLKWRARRFSFAAFRNGLQACVRETMSCQLVIFMSRLFRLLPNCKKVKVSGNCLKFCLFTTSNMDVLLGVA
ncbi:hypothetical protein, partial [Paraburkholderia sp. SIMBA_053]|uniref:hypothetical protein n=1 Tax=Paraburkholderia sp. SIMBA_053 TaxID=3085794 RepID=UPI00397A291D